MKIQYRIQGNFIEIVRCFGSDPYVVLPEMVADRPVRRVAPYAFSARKAEEDTDVILYTTEDTIFEDGEELLAGDRIESVVFPPSVEEIGNYTFYGCKNLRRLEFSDRLMQLGSGAFTGCGRIRYLKVHLTAGEKSCVKEILGDLWQRIDVTFYYEYKSKEDTAPPLVKLVFPEHYEEAVENTPARILFTQHHGTGNNYRQCFYNKEMDYRKYDDLFYLAEAQDGLGVLADMVFRRLGYPYEMTEAHEKMYETYIREHLVELVRYLVENESINRLSRISEHDLWTEEGIDEAIQVAAESEKGEILSFLMNERHLLFPPKKKKKFEL